MIMKNTVTDELVNKVYHLTRALDSAQNIVKTLEKENERLKSLLSQLSYNKDNQEDHYEDYLETIS